MSTQSLHTIKIFSCYAPEDAALYHQFEKHLTILKQLGWIHNWSDRDIPAGADFQQTINQCLDTADLLLLFVSADFFHSEYGSDTAMQVAVRKHITGEAVVIPILLRPVEWKHAPLGGIQVLPRDNRPITSRTNLDEAFTEITAEIQMLVEALRQHVVLVSGTPHQTIALRLAHDLSVHRIPLWQGASSEVLTGLKDGIREASAVVIIASSETIFEDTLKEAQRLSDMYQRPIIGVWIPNEMQDDRQQAPSMRNWYKWIDAPLEREDLALQEIRNSLNRHRRAVSSFPIIPAQEDRGTEREPRNPYKGLRAFTADDAHDFFGRTSVIETLLNLVETILSLEKKGLQQVRLLAVVGASGSGKSSVVKAGLLSALLSGEVFDSAEWIYLDPIVPGIHPLDGLMLALFEYFPEKTLTMLRDDLLNGSMRGLHLYATALANRRKCTHVVLVIDQFEEIFTLTTNENERQQFFDLLVTACTQLDGPLIVVLTLRADFYDRPMLYPALYTLIAAHLTPLLPMELSDLRAVITQPARLPDVQLTFEENLVGDILFDIQGQIGALPLLQFTLDQLFTRREGRRLTAQAYQKIGGVKGALSRHAEEAFLAHRSEKHRELTRTLFLRLIDPGMTEQDTTRRRAMLTELVFTDPEQTALMQETMDVFVKARLLTTNARENIKTTIEVSHEALIREWPRLVSWLRTARDDIRLQQAIGEDAVTWEQNKRPADRLYRGSQLKEARTWAKRNMPSKNEVAFLRASILYRVRFVVSAIAVFLIVISSTGIAGWILTHQAPDPTQVINLQDDGVGSLRWAINNVSPGRTITLPSLKGTIILTNDLLITKKNLTIHGPGAHRLTISNRTHQIHVFSGASISMFDLTFTGSTSNPDSLLMNEGTLTLTNSIISGNTTTQGHGGSGTSPGGITNRGTLTLANSTVSGNSAGGEGSTGGIGNYGILTLNNSTVSGNSAYSGGGITNIGTLTLTNSTVSGNTAPFGGGGIYSVNAMGSPTPTTVTLINSIVSGNAATGYGPGLGGGIYNETGTLTLTNSTVSGNTASGQGGGIYSTYPAGSPATVTLINSTVSGNTATGQDAVPGRGGGIYNENGTLTLTNSTVSGNTASDSGGGIDNSGGTIVIEFCTIYGNKSDRIGGGLSIRDFTDDNGNIITPSQASMRNSIIAGDHAPSRPDISGTLISDGYNLIQNLSAATFAPNKQHNTDLSGDNFPNLGIDPLLRDNGGLAKPHTFTHALLPGSPAIDIIPLDACHVNKIIADQRGVKRPAKNKQSCDSGAYEFQR